MSDVEGIKRLLRALIDLGLEEDISSQLRNLLGIQLMTHREALECHGDLVAKARKGKRIIRDYRSTVWTNGDLVYILTNFSCSVEHAVTSGNHTISLSQQTDGHLDKDADFSHDVYYIHTEGGVRYYVKTTPTFTTISRFVDGVHLCLSYSEGKLHISYDYENTEDWEWIIRVGDKVTISRPNEEDVVFNL